MLHATPRLRAALPPPDDVEPACSGVAFEAHAAAVAPWFRVDDATMDRLAATYAVMAEARALFEAIRPQIERLIELATPALVEVEAICAGIPAEVYDATPELVDDWEVVVEVVGGAFTSDVMALGERLAKIDPPLPIQPAPPAPATGQRKATAQPVPPLPVETVTFLAGHGAPVSWPTAAVRSRRDRESPPQATHFVHWLAQGRRDIAGRGLPWAEGHLEGLRLASSLADWPGELTEHAGDVNGRPDPLAASCAAWVRDENAGERDLLRAELGALEATS